MKRFAVAGFVVAVLAGASVAQDAPKPGPEHDLLKKHVGTWDTTMKFAGMESKGTATYKMELGGLWLTSTFEGDLFGTKFTGRGTRRLRRREEEVRRHLGR
jgi:hypothetical protein